MNSEIKKIINEINIDDLIEIFLVSNTPYYLYKKFKGNGNLFNISQKYETKELQEIFFDILKDDIKTIDKYVLIYALIISLSFKNFLEVKDFFEEIKKMKHKWFKDLSQIYFQNLKTFQFSINNIKSEVKLEIEPKPLSLPQSYSKYEINNTALKSESQKRVTSFIKININENGDN